MKRKGRMRGLAWGRGDGSSDAGWNLGYDEYLQLLPSERPRRELVSRAIATCYLAACGYHLFVYTLLYLGRLGIALRRKSQATNFPQPQPITSRAYPIPSPRRFRSPPRPSNPLPPPSAPQSHPTSPQPRYPRPNQQSLTPNSHLGSSSQASKPHPAIQLPRKQRPFELHCSLAPPRPRPHRRRCLLLGHDSGLACRMAMGTWSLPQGFIHACNAAARSPRPCERCGRRVLRSVSHRGVGAAAAVVAEMGGWRAGVGAAGGHGVGWGAGAGVGGGVGG